MVLNWFQILLEAFFDYIEALRFAIASIIFSLSALFCLDRSIVGGRFLLLEFLNMIHSAELD